MAETLVFQRFTNEGQWRLIQSAGYEALRDAAAAAMNSMGNQTVEIVEVAVLRRSTVKPKRIEVEAEVGEEVDEVTKAAVDNAPAFVLQLAEDGEQLF